MNYNVEIFNANTRKAVVHTIYGGKYYAVVEPSDMGCPFFIRVSNYTMRDALSVVSVDGCSVLTGKEASKDDGGYVLDPCTHYDVKGWRRGNDAVAKFVFEEPSQSYAALTDRPDNIGVVGVAFYQRRSPLRRTSPHWTRQEPIPRGQLEFCSAHPELKGVGAGYGNEVADSVTEAAFIRSMEPPVQFEIYYNTRSQLEKWGIPLPVNVVVPPELSAWPADKKKGPYVPAPTTWRR